MAYLTAEAVTGEPAPGMVSRATRERELVALAGSAGPVPPEGQREAGREPEGPGRSSSSPLASRTTAVAT